MKKHLLLLFYLFTQTHAALENPTTEPLLCEHKIINEILTKDDPEVILLKMGRRSTHSINNDVNALYTGTHKMILRNHLTETEETIHIQLRAPLLFHAIVISSHPKFTADALLQERVFDLIKILCEKKGAQIDQEITCTLPHGQTMTINPLIAAINNQAPSQIIAYFIDHSSTLSKLYPYKSEAHTALYYLITRYQDEVNIDTLFKTMLKKNPDLLQIKEKQNRSLLQLILEHKKYSLIHHVYDQNTKSKEKKNELIEEIIDFLFDSFGTEFVDLTSDVLFFIKKRPHLLTHKTDAHGYSFLRRLVSCNTKKEMNMRELQDMLVSFFARRLPCDELYKGKTLIDTAIQAQCSENVLNTLKYPLEFSPFRPLSTPIRDDNN